MNTAEGQIEDPVVTQHLKYWSKDPPSAAGIRVAKLLDAWDGLHHFDGAMMKKVEWSNPYFIKINLSRDLSTFDFSYLTRLVFLAHDHCIRVEIRPLNMRYLQLVLHPRNARAGGMSARHPTIEQALADYRTSHPASWVKESSTP